MSKDRLLPKTKTRLAVKRKGQIRNVRFMLTKVCRELPEQRETRLDSERESKNEGVSRNYQSNVKTGLWLKEIMLKESAPRNHKNNVKNRLEAQRDNAKRRLAKESQEQSENYHLVFRYSPDDNYTLSRCVQIGTTSKICPYLMVKQWECVAPQEKLNFLNWQNLSVFCQTSENTNHVFK